MSTWATEERTFCFMTSSGHATPASGQIIVYEQGNSNGAGYDDFVYPVTSTISGVDVTWGFATGNGAVIDGRDRAVTSEPRVAGCAHVNAGNTTTARWDLPAGTTAIGVRLARGDQAVGLTVNQTIKLYDGGTGGTLLATFAASTSADDFQEADGTVRARASLTFPQQSYSVSQSYVTVQWNDGGDGDGARLAFIALQPSTGNVTATPTVGALTLAGAAPSVTNSGASTTTHRGLLLLGVG